MVWNLDEEGFLSKKPNPSPFLWKVETEADLSSGVLLELENVLRNEEKELAWVESKNIGHKEKSRRLLHLFQRDLLPGISGAILTAKSDRDTDPSIKPVLIRTKILFYLIIIVLNALMLFYILLFAIQQTKYRQRAWFQSFTLWFMT